MKTKGIIIAIVVLFVAGIFLGAQSEELKRRFLERKPLIDGLKDQGKVGENNRGLLEPRGPLNPEEGRFVNEENGDRETVYREIAGKLNVPPEEVGRRRAQQIAQQAAPGHWLQGPDGNWFRK